MYLQYIRISNMIIKCYEHIAHPQKRILLRKMADSCIGRTLELKHELAALENSDFHFLDHMLVSLKMVPKDMDIKIPEYFKDKSDEENERRKIVEYHLDILKRKENAKYIVTEQEKRERTTRVYIRLLQSHERTRQSRELFREHQKKYILKEFNEIPKLPKKYKEELIKKSPEVAAIIIQKAWRTFTNRNSLKLRYMEEMKLLRMLPRPKRDLMAELEKDRLFVIKRNEEEYRKAKNTLKTEMTIYKVPEMMEKLEDKIRSYFHGYFLLFGSYPVFPSEKDGGSTKMFEVSVDIDSEKDDESKSETEKDSQSQISTDTKSSMDTKRSKDTKSTEDSKSTKDSKSSKVTKSTGSTKDKGQSEKPEGYSLKPSKFLEDLFILQEEYITIWLDKESVNFDKFDDDILKEEVEKEVELEVQLVVDEKMRLELEKLKTALQKDSKKKPKKKSKEKKKGKKEKKGKAKKGKKEKDLTPDRSLQSLVEELVSQNIIVSYPKYNLSDFVGEHNYAGSVLHLAGDPTRDPNPCLGDIRRVVNEYCILPMGSYEIHSKGAFVKSLLIAGPKGAGKKSLIYAVCNEIGATLLDLSAENIQGKYPGKEGKEMLLHLVLKVGRLLQPTIIFIRDAENYFYKKKPASCTLSEPGRLKKDLPKFVKGIKSEDRLMVCGTAVQPFDVDLKALASSYNKTICIFKPDYNCRRSLWREMILKNKGDITRELDMTALCNVSDGFTAGVIESSVKQTLTVRRLAYQKKIPLNVADFLPELSAHVPVYEEENEAYKQWLGKMPIKKKRKALLEMEMEGDVDDEDESEEED